MRTNLGKDLIGALNESVALLYWILLFSLLKIVLSSMVLKGSEPVPSKVKDFFIQIIVFETMYFLIHLYSLYILKSSGRPTIEEDEEGMYVRMAPEYEGIFENRNGPIEKITSDHVRTQIKKKHPCFNFLSVINQMFGFTSYFRFYLAVIIFGSVVVFSNNKFTYGFSFILMQKLLRLGIWWRFCILAWVICTFLCRLLLLLLFACSYPLYSVFSFALEENHK